MEAYEEPPKPMEVLVKAIHEEFDNLQSDGFYGNGEIIQNLLLDYISNHNDWREYAFFCPYRYSRNLVAKSDEYELMVICWSKGQASPIHNHEGQRCWMACASGMLQETQYVYQNNKTSYGTGPLESSLVSTIDEGTVGYITDDIALHVIESIEPVSISIHLYSRPITECNIYCPTTGNITRRKLGYFTQYKEKCPQPTVAAAAAAAAAAATTSSSSSSCSTSPQCTSPTSSTSTTSSPTMQSNGASSPLVNNAPSPIPIPTPFTNVNMMA